MLGTDFPYHAFLPSGKTIIQIDDKPLHLGRRAAVDLGLAGDVGETLRALIPMLEARTDSKFLDKAVKHHDTMVKGIQTYVTHEGSGHGLRPEMVATALSDLADDDAVFTVDTGMCNVWGARYLAMKPGRRILASFSHGSMANAMPQAIGAKVGSPDRQVIAGGLTRAHRGPPRSSVSEIDATSAPSVRVAAASSSGSMSPIMSLARRNMAKDPSAPTSPHVRYRNRSPFLPWTAGPRKSPSYLTSSAHTGAAVSPGTRLTTSRPTWTPTCTSRYDANVRPGGSVPRTMTDRSTTRA
jgi:hypothetical protein